MLGVFIGQVHWKQ